MSPRVHHLLEPVRAPPWCQRSYAREHDTAKMLQEAQQWLTLDPSASTDLGLADDLPTVLLGKDGMEAALVLLTGPMGSRGVDVLYDVGYPSHPSQAPIVTRVRRVLASADVRSHASPAAPVALDLQHTTTCEAKRALLTRARDAPETRAMPERCPSSPHLRPPKAVDFSGHETVGRACIAMASSRQP